MRHIAIIFCIIASCLANAENSVVEGISTAVPDGTPVSLYQMFGRSGRFIASDTIRNGRFRFEMDADTVSDKLLIMSFHNGNATGRHIYMRPGIKVKVMADSRIADVWRIESPISRQAEMDTFMLNSRDLIIKFRTADSFDRDSILNIINMRDAKLLAKLPHSDAWLEKLSDLASLSKIPQKNNYPELKKQLEGLYDSMSEQERSTREGKRSCAFIYTHKRAEMDKPYIDADFYDIDGNLHHVSELPDKWKLLVFWSSGCFASTNAIKELNDIKKRYHERLEIVSISQDAIPLWEKASDSIDMNWHNWNDNQEDYGIFNTYNIRYLPTYAIINPEGIVTDIMFAVSKGFLKLYLSDKFYSELPMQVSRKGKTTTVINPRFSTNETQHSLHVDKIVRGKDATELFFTATYYPGYWMDITSGCAIETQDGNKYHVISADGIKIGEKFYPGDNGDFKFSLKFPPIPADTASITFRETEYYISGLSLTSDQ